VQLANTVLVGCSQLVFVVPQSISGGCSIFWGYSNKWSTSGPVLCPRPKGILKCL